MKPAEYTLSALNLDRFKRDIIYSGAMPSKPTKTTEEVLIEYKKELRWMVGIVVSALLVIMGWYLTNILPSQMRSEIASQDKSVSDKLTANDARLAAIDSKLDMILNMTLKRIAANGPKELSGNLEIARELLSTAKKEGIVLDPNTVISAGRALIADQSEGFAVSPVVWDTAMEFVDYRSYLNAKLNPIPAPSNKIDNKGIVLAPGSSIEYRNSYIADIPVTLDWGKWINNTFHNCKISYKGGPLFLEGARFEDCQFEIAKNQEGKRFAQAILSSSTPTVTIAQSPSVKTGSSPSS
jgi:hypothetical protein